MLNLYKYGIWLFYLLILIGFVFLFLFFFFQAEDGIRDIGVTGVQTCALPISSRWSPRSTWSPTSTRPTTRRRLGPSGRPLPATETLMSTPNSPTTVWVLNGVNLGRLGTRQPEVYGSTTYDELVQRCSKRGSELGLAVECRQTDSEAELVGWLHESADAGVPVILNPGAWSHYSLAVAD